MKHWHLCGCVELGNWVYVQRCNEAPIWKSEVGITILSLLGQVSISLSQNWAKLHTIHYYSVCLCYLHILFFTVNHLFTHHGKVLGECCWRTWGNILVWNFGWNWQPCHYKSATLTSLPPFPIIAHYNTDMYSSRGIVPHLSSSRQWSKCIVLVTVSNSGLKPSWLPRPYPLLPLGLVSMPWIAYICQSILQH